MSQTGYEYSALESMRWVKLSMSSEGLSLYVRVDRCWFACVGVCRGWSKSNLEVVKKCVCTVDTL